MRGRGSPDPDPNHGEGAPLSQVDTDAQQAAEARLAQLATRRAVPCEHLHALAALLGDE